MNDREQLVLQACKKFIQEHEYSPCIRDICELTGINSTSLVRWYLEKLEHERGAIKRNPRISRSIVIVDYVDAYNEGEINAEELSAVLERGIK